MILYAKDVKKLFLAGAHALNEQHEYINELNVFPVPDGDTGTNMTMTIISSAKEVLTQKEDTMDSVCRAIASGALRGARGNSGVILSQLFRGFCKVIRDKESIDNLDVVTAIHQAVESAYKAVMKPKEGTILTVARGIFEKADELKEEQDFSTLLTAVVQYGDEVLAKTPDMLPVLKQAGVVDSGGQGLMTIMHGILDALNGKEVPYTVPEMAEESTEQKTVDTSELETADIKFGYCTEFIIKTEKEFTERDEQEFKGFLTSIGDSIVCVADDGVVKIHVHTNHPGEAIEKALTYGQLSRLKIDNMREEHEERLFKNSETLAREQKEREENVFDPETAKDTGFIGVAAGEGLKELLTSLEFDVVVGGGQTMNPSTEDFLSAIRKVNAKTIFIFPNNGNIIMAATQAANMTEDREIIVIPTKTMPECITAKINYNPDGTAAENTEAMREAISHVTTIEITYAVRDTEIDDVTIQTGDYMALSGKHILACEKDLNDCARKALQKATEEAGADAFVTLYYGADITAETAETLPDVLGDSLNGAEMDVQYGGQPVYYYLISVETM